VNDIPRSAANSPPGVPRDLSIASINEAFRLIGQGDQRLERLEKPKQEDVHDSKKERVETREVAKPTPKLIENSSRSRLSLRGLLGLGALGCIIFAALAWQFGPKQIDPVLASSISRNKEDPAPPLAPESADPAVKQYSAPAEPLPTPQNASIAPIYPEMLQQFQSIVRELANMQQAIDQLKNDQSQALRQNTDLAEQLKATREIARRNAELLDDLKAMQAQMALANGKLTDQLKTNQDSMTAISEQLKQSQERLARPTLADQKLRPRPAALSPQTVNQISKPVPGSTVAQGGPKAQAPPRSAPKQP
jgi:hypothetical protein